MGVPTALRRAREHSGLSQGELGRLVGLSESMVSAIERGERRITFDVAPRVAQLLDYPELYVALAQAATGGVGPAWYDGPRVDEHRMSRARQTMLEMAHAMQSIERADALIDAAAAVDLDPGGAGQLEAILDEAPDAIDELLNLHGRLCLQYGRSYRATWLDRRGELVRKEYVDGREVRRYGGKAA